jgi:putative DNA-invertase from lambdoid prophage Rac
MTAQEILTSLSNDLVLSMSRVFAYARVSSVAQLTENQRGEIKAAGYTVTPQRFIEETVSGSVSASQRPGFQKLLERMETGDTLVVTKLDRLGRDSIDVQQTVARFEAAGMKLIVLQLGNLDLTSSAGSLMVKMLAAVADFERELIIERTQAGQARARAEGKHMGRPSKTTPEDKVEIRRLLAQGITVSEVARQFSGKKGESISRATVIGIRDQA